MYSGHGPNGFHNSQFEKTLLEGNSVPCHCHLRAQAREGVSPSAVKSTAPRIPWKLMHASETVRGCPPVARVGHSTWQLQAVTATRRSQRPGL